MAGDLRTDKEFQDRLRSYSQDFRPMTPNMWIGPDGEVFQVDSHWDFVAQARFGIEGGYEEFADTARNQDEAYDRIGQEAEDMLKEGWIRVVGQGGGVSAFSNDIGIQGTLDSLIRNQRVLDREVVDLTRANELIVEVVRPGDGHRTTFYVNANDAREGGLVKTMMRERIAKGVPLSELRRREVRVRAHRRSR